VTSPIASSSGSMRVSNVIEEVILFINLRWLILEIKVNRNISVPARAHVRFRW
jgi:hypothetical protein